VRVRVPVRVPDGPLIVESEKFCKDPRRIALYQGKATRGLPNLFRAKMHRSVGLLASVLFCGCLNTLSNAAGVRKADKSLVDDFGDVSLTKVVVDEVMV
jgi:hypothetical protein